MSAQGFPTTPYINPNQLGECVIGARMSKGPLTLPQNATGTLFTVLSAVLVTEFVGVVTTGIGAAANTLSLGLVPTIGSANTAGIGGPTDIHSTAAGQVISVPAAIGTSGATGVVTPSVPGSGVPVVNNYHGTVQVVVSGGTLTGVSINGVNAGAGDGTYQLPMHGTISWAGSLAPTWAWSASTALPIGPSGSVSIGKEHIIPAGLVTWTTTAAAAGAITWYLNYAPLDPTIGQPSGAIGLVV